METPHGYAFLKKANFLQALASAVKRWALEQSHEADSSLVVVSCQRL